MSGKPLWSPAAGLVAGYGGLAAATAVGVLAGGTRRPGVALALLAVTAFVLGTRTPAWVAASSGLVGWLFYDGFIAGRHANLAWHGVVDARRLGLLAGCAAAGAGARWLHDRRAAAGTVVGQLANLTDLAQARAARRGLCR